MIEMLRSYGEETRPDVRNHMAHLTQRSLCSHHMSLLMHMAQTAASHFHLHLSKSVLEMPLGLGGVAW